MFGTLELKYWYTYFMDEQESFDSTQDKQQNTDSNDEQEVNQIAPTPLPPPPSHKKLVVGVLAVFALVVVGVAVVYFVFQSKAKPADEIQQIISKDDVEQEGIAYDSVFTTQEECENTNKKYCGFYWCEGVPSGEVCKEGSKPGWYPIIYRGQQQPIEVIDTNETTISISQPVIEPRDGITGVFTWDEQHIAKADGTTFITIDSFPKTVHVSSNELDPEGFDAMPQKRIVEVVVSPNNSRLAIVTSDHDATQFGREMGWVYVIASDTFSSASYEAIVEIKGWSPDSNFIVFLEVNPFPFPSLTVVDVRTLTGNPWTTGTYVSDLIPEEDEDEKKQILWPKIFNYIGWIDGLLCVESDTQYCLDLENNTVQK